MYGYGGYQPTYYTPGQAMPGQLEQLRMNQQPNQQMMQQQTRPQSPMIWVQGEAGAKSYMVAAGNTVALWDSEQQTIYLKSCDQMGMPSMRYLDYTERTAPKPPTAPPAAAPGQEYATRAELQALEAKIEAISAPKSRAKKEAVTDESAV